MAHYSTSIMSWEDLGKLISNDSDFVNGPTNSYSNLRLFGQSEGSLRVTLYRDNHAWCPYCQKVWLWLEFKKIPYQIKKVTMRCYGQKEPWYIKKVPSGMLPAIEIDGILITESDQILLSLEKVFGPLGKELESDESLELRMLERRLFSAWCRWLCSPNQNIFQENRFKDNFKTLCEKLEVYLSKNEGTWFDSKQSKKQDSSPGSSDIVFIPFLERMNASLTYYKGMNIREEYILIDNWFQTLERKKEYLGTQGDIHTHVHDLPPQMGGCWTSPSKKQKEFAKSIDLGIGLGQLETSFRAKEVLQREKPEIIALARIYKHRDAIINLNPITSNEFDQPLRAALTTMITGERCKPAQGSAIGLRYLKDRVSVPRDMPLLSARKFRIALEETAQIDSEEQGPPITTNNRFDQDPKPFLLTNKSI